LFGVLSGAGPEPVDPEVLAPLLPVLELLADLLSVVLRADRLRTDASRRAQAALLAAETDALTGLLNRRAWDQIVKAEDAKIARLGDLAVAVSIDLDGLKDINDTQGHHAGDIYLCAAAAVLARQVRGRNVVARIGGDEFACLLLGLRAEDAGGRVAAITHALAAEGISASVGWAPVGQTGVIDALRQADHSMYAVKHRRIERRRAAR
jgi:diguanylate cyclase (GGDEF)-like protein